MNEKVLIMSVFQHSCFTFIQLTWQRKVRGTIGILAIRKSAPTVTTFKFRPNTLMTCFYTVT